MSGDVVNLRRVRKAKARAAEAAVAADNRLRHGRTRADKEAQATIQAAADRHLDNHRLSPTRSDDER